MTQHLLQISSDYQVLLNYGPLGVFCLWFMWRVEKLIEKISTLSHRFDGITRAMLLEVTTRPHVPDQVRRAAEDMVMDIETRDRKGK